MAACEGSSFFIIALSTVDPLTALPTDPTVIVVLAEPTGMDGRSVPPMSRPWIVIVCVFFTGNAAAVFGTASRVRRDLLARSSTWFAGRFW